MGLLDIFRPNETVLSVEDIDLDALAARGIEGLLIDVDNTLIPHGVPDLSPERMDWAERAVGRFRVCLVSNSLTGKRMRKLAGALGIPGIAVWHWDRKPFTGGVRRAMRLIGTTPENTAMIGDQVMTDILAGNRAGLHTIWVKQIGQTENLLTRLIHRPLEACIVKRLGCRHEEPGAAEEAPSDEA